MKKKKSATAADDEHQAILVIWLFCEHARPSWERSTLGPGGNMRQVYWWTEPSRR